MRSFRIATCAFILASTALSQQRNSSSSTGPRTIAEAQDVVDGARSGLWNLTPQLKQDWKDGLRRGEASPVDEEYGELGDMRSNSVAVLATIPSDLSDERIKQIRFRFQVPEDEEIFYCVVATQQGFGNISPESGGVPQKPRVFEAVYTDLAIYLLTDDLTSSPSGRLRVSHEAMMAADKMYWPKNQKELSVSGQPKFSIAGREVITIRTISLYNALVKLHDYVQRFAVAATRQTAITSEPEVVPFTGYKIVPWGVSMAEVKRKFRVSAASAVWEYTISASEWSRLKLMMPFQETGAEWSEKQKEQLRLPFAPPFGYLRFEDAEQNGSTEFFFFRDRLYAVVHWLVRGSDAKAVPQTQGILTAMRKKYGEARLEIPLETPFDPNARELAEKHGEGPVAWAVWERKAGVIRAALSAMPAEVSSLQQSLVIRTPTGSQWDFEVRAAGFSAAKLVSGTEVILRHGSQSNQYHSPFFKINLPLSREYTAVGKWLVVIFGGGTSTPVDETQFRELAAFVGSTFVAIDKFGRESRPVRLETTNVTMLPATYRFDQEMLRGFDVPVDAEDIVLKLPSEKPDGPARIISLQLTSSWWSFGGLLDEASLSRNKAILEKVVYSSADICHEIEALLGATKSAQQRKRREEQEHQKNKLEKEF